MIANPKLMDWHEKTYIAVAIYGVNSLVLITK